MATNGKLGIQTNEVIYYPARLPVSGDNDTELVRILTQELHRISRAFIDMEKRVRELESKQP